MKQQAKALRNTNNNQFKFESRKKGAYNSWLLLRFWAVMTRNLYTIKSMFQISLHFIFYCTSQWGANSQKFLLAPLPALVYKLTLNMVAQPLAPDVTN
jgi:hypothetical protein